MRLIRRPFGISLFVCYSNETISSLVGRCSQIKLISLVNARSFSAAFDDRGKRKEKLKPKVVFFGTDLLSIRILKGLHELLKCDHIESIKAVTSVGTAAKHQSDETALRSNRIVDYCSKNNIEYHLWPEIKTKKSTNYDNLFQSYHVGVVASFGHLIPAALIETFPYGILNVHPSLLPRWRGASPIIYSILFNDQKVGVSLMKIMPKKFDVGPLLMQRSVDTPVNITSLKLLDCLADIGNQMLADVFKDFENSIQLSIEQTNKNVLYAHKITSQMYFVDWANQTSTEVDCQYRGLHELGNLKTNLNGNVVKLLDMILENTPEYKKMAVDVEKMGSNDKPGVIRFLYKHRVIAIKCKERYVFFKSLVLKKKLSAQDFYNGYLNNRSDVKFQSVKNTMKDHIHLAKII